MSYNLPLSYKSRLSVPKFSEGATLSAALRGNGDITLGTGIRSDPASVPLDAWCGHKPMRVIVTTWLSQALCHGAATTSATRERGRRGFVASSTRVR